VILETNKLPWPTE